LLITGLEVIGLKIRLAYTKKKEAKYIAHLDLARMFDRALRRAQLQVAFSEGFNPHPKIAFGPPLPVGVESEREFVDIELKEPVEFNRGFLTQVVTKLQKQMPPGIDLIDAAVRPQRDDALMAVINRAHYKAEVPFREAVTADILDQACRNWLAREEVLIERAKDKNSKNPKNIRPFVKKLQILETRLHPNEQYMATMFFDLVTGNQGSVRPFEILESLAELERLPIDLPGVAIVRVGLYVEKADGSLFDPLRMLK